MLNLRAAEIFSAIESLEKWEHVCHKYTKAEIVQVCDASIAHSSFYLVQAIKALGCLSEYEARRELLVSQMKEYFYPMERIAPHEMVFQGRCDAPRKVLLLCGGVSEKIERIVTELSRLGISYKIVCIANFSPNKPYELAPGTWYFPEVKTVRRNLEIDIDVGHCRTEEDLAALCEECDYLNALTLCLGTGMFSTGFLQRLPYGLINVHNGLLPDIRGLDSPAWSLLSAKEYCVTLHVIDQRVDLGRRIAAIAIPGGGKSVFDQQITSTVVSLIAEVTLNRKWPVSICIEGGKVFPMLGRHASECLNAAIST